MEQLAAQLTDKRPEGTNQKTLLSQKTPAKLKTFDSSISPSGLLERLVIGFFEFFKLQ